VNSEILKLSLAFLMIPNRTPSDSFRGSDCESRDSLRLPWKYSRTEITDAFMDASHGENSDGGSKIKN
jgi:hypothetical protein